MTGDNDEDSFPKFGLNSDISSYEDYLGFKPYVMAVKEFITSNHTEPPLTVSIEGDWGSGKTTFMNILEESLKDSGHKTVRFNPWRHEDKEAVWAAFASELIQELKNDTPFCERLNSEASIAKRRYYLNTDRWQKAKSFLTIASLSVLLIFLILLWAFVFLDWVFEQAGVPSGPLESIKQVFRVSGSLGIIVGYFKLMSTIKKDVGKPLEDNLVAYASNPDYNSKSDFVSEFHEDFGTILDGYLDDNERVYIFIDDLDRCSVPRAADLMQSINLLVSDDDRLVFVLG